MGSALGLCLRLGLSLRLSLRSTLRACLLGTTALAILSLRVDLLHLAHGEDFGKLAQVFLLHLYDFLLSGEACFDLLLNLSVGERLGCVLLCGLSLCIGLRLLAGLLSLRLTLRSTLGSALRLSALVAFLAFLSLLAGLVMLGSDLRESLLILLVERDELLGRGIVEHKTLGELLGAIVFALLLGLLLVLGLLSEGDGAATEGEHGHEGDDDLLHSWLGFWLLLSKL